MYCRVHWPVHDLTCKPKGFTGSLGNFAKLCYLKCEICLVAVVRVKRNHVNLRAIA